MRRTLVMMAAALTACAGSETGNGFTEVSLELRAFNEAAELFARDKDEVVFRIDAAFVAVDRLELIGDGNENVSMIGPWLVDLVSGSFTPSLAMVDLPRGDYSAIEADIVPSDALGGESLQVSGTVVLNDIVVPYSLGLALEDRARFAAMTTFDLTGPATIGLLLDVRTWFDELPLGRCILDGRVPAIDGVALLDQSTGPCSNIENRIRKAIREAGKLAKDKKPE